jgi:hypothetical protein
VEGFIGMGRQQIASRERRQGNDFIHYFHALAICTVRTNAVSESRFLQFHFGPLPWRRPLSFTMTGARYHYAAANSLVSDPLRYLVP